MYRRRWFLLPLLLLIVVLAVAVSDDSDADGGGSARIGETYYGTLDEALSDAVSGNTVIVMDGCHLSSDAVVPSGVTLLLPYSDGHGGVDPDGFEYGPSPSSGGNRKKADDQYCVTHLYIDAGARLTVYGDLIIGGVVSEMFTFDYQGHTYGEHGRIVLQGDLYLMNGSSLRCYGYITGGGIVHADSGSAVYEPFIIADFVGGDRMKNLFNAKQSPFDRYSFSNIEAQLVLEYGSCLVGLINIYANGSINSSEINIIGVGGSHVSSLIELHRNSRVSITYDADRYVKADWESNIWSDFGRTRIVLSGGADFNTLVFQFMGRSASMDGVVFSIPYNFEFVLTDGVYNMNAELRILPGAAVTVSETATLVVNSRLYVFNGLEDVAYRGKYYPGPELLDQYGFSNHGSLFVNGILKVSSGAVAVGIIESTSGASVITVDGGVEGYRNWDVGYGFEETVTRRS